MYVAGLAGWQTGRLAALASPAVSVGIIVESMPIHSGPAL